MEFIEVEYSFDLDGFTIEACFALEGYGPSWCAVAFSAA